MRKGLKGEDEAQGKIRQVDASGPPKGLRCFVQEERELAKGRDGLGRCVIVCDREAWLGVDTDERGGGWVVGSRNRFGVASQMNPGGEWQE